MQTQTPQPIHQTPPVPVNNDPRAEFQRQEQERRTAVRNVLAPFADRHPEIVQRAMDDMSITPDQASAMLLKAMGENLTPLTIALSHGEMTRNSMTSTETHGGYGRDQVRNAMIDGLLIRHGIKVKNPHVAARDFSSMSIHEMSRIMLRDNGRSHNGLTGQELIQRAMSTSDLPYLLQDLANKALISGFESSDQSHDVFATFVDVPDFKTQSRIALSAFESLDSVPELGEVTYSNLNDNRETYQISSYQKAISFSRQMLVNDDLMQLTLIPEKLGVAARRTEADLVYSIFNSNPVMSDGIALFHASHNNLLTASVLSVSALGTAVATLRKAKDISGRGFLGVKPQWLVVPPELEILALQTIASLTNTKANANAIPDSDLAKFTVVVEPRLTSATAWFLLGSGIETIEVGRLSSSYGAGISFETDNDFDTDAYNYKVRLDAGAKALSPTGMIKNPGL